ncbi:hypothetical protein BELL_0776g00050 [Botrytis elliptica]|uniref:Uncharacterized protein n=1 Tax=Botrytis elliptica TaxID=278938 RepID=A0A4Z1JD91_9HELO|nr:hypothetical protein BELL_0776g00050 [Botrytis elliptica]
MSSIGNLHGKVKCCDGWGPRTHEHEDPLMLHTRSRRKVESGKSGALSRWNLEGQEKMKTRPITAEPNRFHVNTVKPWTWRSSSTPQISMNEIADDTKDLGKSIVGDGSNSSVQSRVGSR